MQENLPQDKSDDNIEFVKWQKNYHKLQRDFYLSLSAMLAQALLVGLSYWIEKYDSYVEFKDREIKAMKSK